MAQIKKKASLRNLSIIVKDEQLEILAPCPSRCSYTPETRISPIYTPEPCNFLTPKRQTLKKLEEKVFQDFDIVDEEEILRQERVDKFGNKIKKGGKRHKIVFADNKIVNKPLEQIHLIDPIPIYFMPSYTEESFEEEDQEKNDNFCQIF